MIDRRTLRRMFLSAFESEGLDYVGGASQIAHPELTWMISLVVDGTGPAAPYRLIRGASLPELGDLAPRNAEDCYMILPVAYEGSGAPGPDALRMPDAVFPEWSGSDDERAKAIVQIVASVLRYAQEVDSMDELRDRYSAGNYDGALIIAPLRKLLDRAS